MTSPPRQLSLRLDNPSRPAPESATGWYTVKQFCARNPAFTVSSARSIIFDAERFGVQEAVGRFGRKVLIHEEKWFEALQQQTQKKGN